MTEDSMPPTTHIAQPMTFAPEIALDYARTLARPRRVGSGEDEAVAQDITRRLEHCGWTVERQPFQFSGLVNVVVAVEILILLAVVALSSRINAGWVPALVILMLIFSTDRIIHAAQARAIAPGAASRRRARFLPQFAAANLVAIPPRSPDNPSLPHLYLVAHYDSKSQFVPIVVRVALFVAAIGGGAAFAGLTLGGLIFPALIPAAEVAGILALVAGVPLAVLLLVQVGNASPGAIDNASGVGTVLHLAEVLTAHPDVLNRLRVTILLTSAEEFGLLGAAAYVQQNESRLRRQTEAGGQHISNFDSVGVAGALHYVGAPARSPRRLVNLIRQACGQLNIPVRKYFLPGALFDHMPFAQHEFDAVSLTAIGPATRHVHTPADSTDKLNVRGFEQAGRVAMRVIEKLAGRGTEGTTGTE
jgi:hypothetical protein